MSNVFRAKSIDYVDNDAESSVRSKDIDQFHVQPMQNRLDVKYELFLKWLQSNEMVAEIQTDDEFTSQVLTSDDEDDFVDTQTEYPLISLREVDSTATTPEPNECQVNIYSKLLSVDSLNDLCDGECSGKSTPTPGGLTVTSIAGYDSSTSDISGISDNTKLLKRKAKHSKEKAPPIPIPLSVQMMQEFEASQINAPVPVHVEEKSEKKTILSFLPDLFRSKSPAKNQPEAETIDGNDDKFETQI